MREAQQAPGGDCRADAAIEQGEIAVPAANEALGCNDCPAAGEAAAQLCALADSNQAQHPALKLVSGAPKLDAGKVCLPAAKRESDIMIVYSANQPGGRSASFGDLVVPSEIVPRLPVPQTVGAGATRGMEAKDDFNSSPSPPDVSSHWKSGGGTGVPDDVRLSMEGVTDVSEESLPPRAWFPTSKTRASKARTAACTRTGAAKREHVDLR